MDCPTRCYLKMAQFEKNHYICKKGSMTELENIKEKLGTPYHETEYGLIYNMDCAEGLKRLSPIRLINSTITSPPYNIGKEYESVVPYAQYIDWLANILSLVNTVTSDNGSLLLNIGYLSIENQAHAIPIPYLIWDKINMFFQQEIVWNYGAGVSCKNYLSPRNEKILWYVKDKDNYTFNLDEIRDPNVKYPNQKKHGKLRCNTLGKNPSDVWQIAKVTSGTNRSSIERTSHPAQFPEDLIVRLIKGFTNQNDIVLDPFMGSGTVAGVAIKNKRKYLGFEILPHYCEISKKRIESTIGDQKSSLFPEDII